MGARKARATAAHERGEILKGNIGFRFSAESQLDGVYREELAAGGRSYDDRPYDRDSG
jgi:hypothetical protein